MTVDPIGELVDEQLKFRRGSAAYPECPYCGRLWHGLPIFEGDKFVCSGANFVGTET